MRLIPDDVLALITIWQECRGGSFAGKCCIGEVIRERMRTRFMSDGSVSGTVLVPYQFSGWNTSDPNRHPSLEICSDDPVVLDCQKAWGVSASSQLTKGAVIYFDPAHSNPHFVANVRSSCVLTHTEPPHEFYRPRSLKPWVPA